MIRDVVFSLLAKDKTGRAIQSAERGLSRLRNAAKRVSRALGGIKGAIAAGLGGAAIRSSAQMADKMEKLSVRLGITTEALSQLRYGADLAGVTFEQMTMGIQRMTRRVAEAAQGTGEAKNALAELGVDAKALARLKPEQQFEVLAEALNRVENQSDKVRLAFKLFDSEGVGMLQMMENGADGVRAFREEAEKLGITLSQTEAEGIASMNDAWARLKGTLGGIVMKITAALAPALEWVANFLSTVLITAIDIAKGAFQGLKMAFLIVAEGITEGIAFLVEKLAVLPRLLKEALSLGKDIPLIGDGFAGAASGVESLEKAITGYSDSLSDLVKITDTAGDETGELSDGMKKLRQETAETDKVLNKIGTGVSKVGDAADKTRKKTGKLKDEAKDTFDVMRTESKRAADDLIKNFSDSVFGLGGGGESFGESMKKMFAQMNSELLQNTLKGVLYGGDEGGGLFGGLFGGGGGKSAGNGLVAQKKPNKGMCTPDGEVFAEEAGPILGEIFGESSGGFFDSFKDILGSGTGDGFLGMLSNVFSSAGSIFSNLFSGLGSSLSSLFGFAGGGGGSGLLGSIANIAGSFFGFGGFFADGGTVKPGKSYIVGERGPELFSPNTVGSIVPNGAMAGAPVTVNMNIQTPDARSFRSSQSQIAADMARQIEKARRNL